MTSRSKHSIVSGGRVIYLSNKELLPEVVKSLEKGEMTNLLAKMLLKLCQNYARKGSYINYSYNEEMQGYAMMMLVRTWKGFNPEKSENPFAFYTQCIKNSFTQYLNYESKQRRVRDHIMIDQGLNPSFNYSSGRTGFDLDDEQDFDRIRTDAENLPSSKFVDAPIERDDTGQEIVPEPAADDDVQIDASIPDIE